MATPLQYSCLENPMDRGSWWAAVHGVTKSWAQLSNFTFTFYFPALEKEMATHSSIIIIFNLFITPVFLPRESHGQRILVGCSPQSCKGQPTPVFLPGELSGRGAWWATVHGVTKSHTTEQLTLHVNIL